MLLLPPPQVNNAGILPLEWTREAFDRCLSTNVAGPVMLTEQLLPHMQQGGTVVMVSSGQVREAGRLADAGQWSPRLTVPVCCMPLHAPAACWQLCQPLPSVAASALHL